MNRLDRNTVRSALKDDGQRIPNSLWDLTHALEPLDRDDPFASLFNLDSFEAKWIGDAPSKPLSDVETRLNGQYCHEVEAISRIVFDDAASPSDESRKESEAATARLKEVERRVSRAMAAWDKYVSPIVISEGRVYVIRQPNYLMRSAIIRSMSVLDFANAVVVHCAAFRERIIGLKQALRRRDGVIVLLVILLLGAVVWGLVT